MKDLIIASVKTGTSTAIGSLVAWLASFGIEVGDKAEVLSNALFIVIVALVNFGFNWAGKKWPNMNTILSLGMTKGSPSY